MYTYEMYKLWFSTRTSEIELQVNLGIKLFIWPEMSMLRCNVKMWGGRYLNVVAVWWIFLQGFSKFAQTKALHEETLVRLRHRVWQIVDSDSWSHKTATHVNGRITTSFSQPFQSEGAPRRLIRGKRGRRARAKFRSALTYGSVRVSRRNVLCPQESERAAVECRKSWLSRSLRPKSGREINCHPRRGHSLTPSNG